ncbi:unnamed protein product [Rotaria sp. Silwood2]|nr:unnamed protein product [Rotaria sp. Silwood2]
MDKNTITNDEIKEELEIKYKSIYALENIIGTLNLRNRHVRIDLQDEKEYNKILRSGKLTIFGQLIECDEYLPAPKLLICSKCNSPGHTKQRYQSQWPSLPSASLYSSTTSLNDNLIETTKSLSNELKIIKENYAAEQKRLEERYNNHLNLMNQSWLIMQQQMQTQTEMLNTMDGIINSILFTSCANVMEVLTQTVLKLLNENNHTELNPILALLQQQTLYMNDKKSIYTSHQIKLNMLVEKQREALKSALNTIIKQPNVQ